MQEQQFTSLQILIPLMNLPNMVRLRYRGYYYDTETGFYYLQSRYYDPVNHRFINADVYASTGEGFAGTNMFAYCRNCPVILADDSGTDAYVVIAKTSQEFITGYGFVTVTVVAKAKAVADIWDIEIDTLEESKNSISISVGSSDKCTIALNLDSLFEIGCQFSLHLSDDISLTISEDGVGFTLTISSSYVDYDITLSYKPKPTSFISGTGFAACGYIAGGGNGGVAGFGIAKTATYSSAGGCYADFCGPGGRSLFGNNLNSFI